MFICARAGGKWMHAWLHAGLYYKETVRRRSRFLSGSRLGGLSSGLTQARLQLECSKRVPSLASTFLPSFDCKLKARHRRTQSFKGHTSRRFCFFVSTQPTPSLSPVHPLQQSFRRITAEAGSAQTSASSFCVLSLVSSVRGHACAI